MTKIGLFSLIQVICKLRSKPMANYAPSQPSASLQAKVGLSLKSRSGFAPIEKYVSLQAKRFCRLTGHLGR